MLPVLPPPATGGLMAEEDGDPGKEAGDEWEWRLIVDPC
jgi:hypothetical protein